MKLERIGLYFTRFLILLISIKLVLSYFVKDDVDGIIENSLISNLYYSTDIVILIILILSFIIYLNYSVVYHKSILNLYLIVLGIITVVIFSALLNNISIFSGVSSILKFTLPILLLLFLINFKPVLNKKLLWFLPVTILALSLFALLFFEKSQNRGEFFWPIYFSGLHTQAYVVLAAFFVPYYKWISNRKKIGVILLLTAIFYSLAIGYNVRTSVLALISFIIFQIGHQLWVKNYRGILFISIYITISFSLLFYLNSFSLEDYDMESSGRLSVYLERLTFINNRGFVQNIFGSGPGSDIMETDTWWWEAKGSHNDYLTVFIEFGSIYLILLISLFRMLFVFFKNHAIIIGILTAYIVSSLISNGFMFRPVPSYILFIGIGFIYNLQEQKRFIVHE